VEKTNKNCKYVPKTYDTFISGSSKVDELLIYRKDEIKNDKRMSWERA
jgi:hypothetical protein